jgi:hypothetical protein
MAGWNTPARNAAINKRPCDQKTRCVFGHCWKGQHRSGGCSPTDLHGGCLRSSLMDVFCGHGRLDYVGITTGVAQIADELLQRPSRQSRAKSCRNSVNLASFKDQCVGSSSV